MLTKYGATEIMKQYDADNNVIMLVFNIPTKHGKTAIKLPVNADKILEVFKLQVHNKLLPSKYWEGEWAVAQAHRVAWRIIKDWLDAQLTIINIDMVNIEQIFLPYFYSSKHKKTLYELLDEGNFNLDLLEG